MEFSTEEHKNISQPIYKSIILHVLSHLFNTNIRKLFSKEDLYKDINIIASTRLIKLLQENAIILNFYERNLF